MNFNRVMEFTFYLIVLYLVVVNYRGFVQVITSLGGVYTASVKTLQGRG